jgi:hypothetical protein
LRHLDVRKETTRAGIIDDIKQTIESAHEVHPLAVSRTANMIIFRQDKKAEIITNLNTRYIIGDIIESVGDIIESQEVLAHEEKVAIEEVTN